mmetsp:Transcript_21534/g.48608  ORF Transcript_21534/g.48608 Transcript_21534/m.48608 type:complete len:241 (-) Transcript_21534:519-1241(-)
MTVVGWKTSSLATRNTVGPHYVGRQSRISLGLEVQQRLRGPSWAATTVPVAPSLAPERHHRRPPRARARPKPRSGCRRRRGRCGGLPAAGGRRPRWGAARSPGAHLRTRRLAGAGSLRLRRGAGGPPQRAAKWQSRRGAGVGQRSCGGRLTTVLGLLLGLLPLMTQLLIKRGRAIPPALPRRIPCRLHSPTISHGSWQLRLLVDRKNRDAAGTRTAHRAHTGRRLWATAAVPRHVTAVLS